MMRLPFFLSMQSCPRRCIYCHQGEITGVFDIPSPEHVEAAAASATRPAEVCFFGGSFTCLPPNRQKAYLDGILKLPGEAPSDFPPILNAFHRQFSLCLHPTPYP